MRILLYLMCVCLWVVSGSTAAQTAQEPISINRSSPAGVYQSFIDATKRLEENYAQYSADKSKQQVQTLLGDLRRIRNLLDLSEVPPATRVRVGNTAVTQLYDILARLPAVDLETVPGFNEPEIVLKMNELPVRWIVPGTDIQIARIEDGPHAGEYQFSADTITHLAEYYQSLIDLPVLNSRIYPNLHLEQSNATGPLIPNHMTQDIPEILQKHYFDTPVWKIITIAIIWLLGLVVASIWVRYVWRKTESYSGLPRLGWLLSTPIVLWLVLYCADLFITTQVNPVGGFANNEGLIISILYYCLFAWFAWLLVYFVVESIIYSSQLTLRSHDEPLLQLIAKLVAIVAVISILIKGVDELGIPALGLVAGLGVGGIAVALASQSTIENIFGGLSLFADRPFSVGDKIYFNKQSATVLRVGPRSTRLRTRDGALCTVPNSDLAKMHVINFTLRSCCYMDQTISLRHDSDAERIRLLLAQIRENIQLEELVEIKDGWPRVQLVGMGVGHIDIRIRATFLTTDYSEFLVIQENVMMHVLESMRNLGLKLAQQINIAALNH